MILRAVLTGAVLTLVGWGRLPALPLLAGSGLLGLLLAWGSRKAGHAHTLELVEQTARRSPLSEMSPGAKVLLCLAGLLACVTARSLVLVLLLWGAALGVLLGPGGMSLRRYLRLLALPGTFLLLGALALVADLGPVPGDVLALSVPGGFLSVTEAGQHRAALVTLRAFGGVSWMYALALTTPMAQLLELFQRWRLPKTLVELMFLTYRYLFLLWGLLESMSQAARCRLGWRNFSAGVRTSGAAASILLVRSLGQARRSLAAMEARCWRGDVSLEGTSSPEFTVRQALGAGMLTTGMALAWILSWRGGWP